MNYTLEEFIDKLEEDPNYIDKITTEAKKWTY
jgi:hypothetical protein